MHLLAAFSLAAALGPASLDAAQVWREVDSEVSLSEWGVVAAPLLTAGVLAMSGAQLDPWLSAPALDAGARSRLRLATESRRLAARDASDALVTLALAYPIAVDALFVAAYRHDNRKLAWRLSLIAAEVYAVNTGLTTALKQLTNRERPYGVDCGHALPNDTHACTGASRRQSFPSGHTSSAFSAATLTCVYHVGGLLGASGDGGLPLCAAALSVASATGLLRIMGDRHYASDVLAGAAVGVASGLLAPWLARQHGARSGELGDGPEGLWIVPTTAGVQLVGEF